MHIKEIEKLNTKLVLVWNVSLSFLISWHPPSSILAATVHQSYLIIYSDTSDFPKEEMEQFSQQLYMV